jgi:hypothetical protein
MIKRIFPILILILVFGSCHEKKESKEQKPKRVSIAEIEAGIKSFIQKKTEENGGYFEVSDRGKDFRMKLVRVHTEYLSNLGPKRNFACVDLADERGDVYDVDFFLDGEPGAMTVTETSVHKLNGKPYYAWKQKPDKTWNRIPVKEATTRLLGVMEGSDSFEFHYQVELPEINGEAKMWIPIATTDEYQQIEIAEMKVPMEYKLLNDKEFNNTILYVALNAKESKKTIDILYKVKRIEK